MEILLGPLLVVDVFVETFFVVPYNSGQSAFHLGFCLSNFLSARPNETPVLLLSEVKATSRNRDDYTEFHQTAPG